MYASSFKFEILKILVIHYLFRETPNDDRGEKLIYQLTMPLR